MTPALHLQEECVGSGGKCGSVALDKEFLKLVENRVGEGFKKWRAQKTSAGSPLMKAFDRAKQSFVPTTIIEPWLIPLGYVEDDLANGIEDGEMKLTVYGVPLQPPFCKAEASPVKT
jgi:hypothetical protein